MNFERQELRAVSEVEISPHGTRMWLEGYGLIKGFLIVSKDGEKQYWATGELELTELERVTFAEWSWKIRNIIGDQATDQHRTLPDAGRTRPTQQHWVGTAGILAV